MEYADVVVTCRTGRGTGSFSYAVPAEMRLRVGTLVWVPFGRQRVQGVVVGLTDKEPPVPTKEVLSAYDGTPALTPAQIALARWIGFHYCCSLGVAITPFLPAELRQKMVPIYSLTGGQPSPDLSPRALAIVNALSAGPLPLAKVRQMVPGREGAKALRALVEDGTVAQAWAPDKPSVRVKMERSVQLALAGPPLTAALAALRRASRQAEALRWLAANAADGSPVALSEFCAESGASPAAVAALVRHGYVALVEQEVKRSPLANLELPPARLPVLTGSQARALAAIVASLRGGNSQVFLLHGVTGSGKGEVYLHALTAAVKLGKQALVMVPEIALTPQTIRRFASHFAGRVAVLHSRLSTGEHYDEWRRIRDGEVDVVIGSRSAIFAPIARLGLIVVDEEHEWSYKQTETAPRYHARDVAVALGALVGATVVLGSATPDVVTYRLAAEMKQYRLLELPERVEGGRPTARAQGARAAEGEANPGSAGPPPTIPLPTVQVVDMRSAARAAARPILSAPLRRALAETLQAGSQAILFLNRRGTATFVMCRACGYVPRCRRCDVPLVYHADRGQLLCHHCNRTQPAPEVCPDCWSRQVSYYGLGTQRVEAEVRRLFPKARVVRWDRDTTRGKAAHGQLLERFLRGEADVIVGTQMVAKGLDLPQVALVGVVAADIALQLPDFRASERTFQLLTQVAGRAGRGRRSGRVIVQTFSPDHYCVLAASRHDYASFYKQEIAFRAAHRYPPFAELARLVYLGSSETRCRRETERLAAYLRAEIDRRGLPDLEIIGPAPAFRRRLRGRYRWHIIVRGGDCRPLLAGLPLHAGWSLDVDPISLL